MIGGNFGVIRLIGRLIVCDWCIQFWQVLLVGDEKQQEKCQFYCFIVQYVLWLGKLFIKYCFYFELMGWFVGYFILMYFVKDYFIYFMGVCFCWACIKGFCCIELFFKS